LEQHIRYQAKMTNKKEKQGEGGGKKRKRKDETFGGRCKNGTGGLIQKTQLGRVEERRAKRRRKTGKEKKIKND